MNFSEAKWNPEDNTIRNSNIYKAYSELEHENYQEFYQWSSDCRESFWELTSKKLNIKFKNDPSQFLNTQDGNETAHWLYGSKLNIAESCFDLQTKIPAIIYQESPDSPLKELSHQELHKLCCQIANGLKDLNLNTGDAIAIDMPMTVEAVAIYLGAILAGMKVVTVADSFSPEEIKVRLDISDTKYVFTTDSYKRAGKVIKLYDKVKQAGDYFCIVISDDKQKLIGKDLIWSSFLSSKTNFEAHIANPEDTMTILFSSGTTGNPKAIPWNHITPIKSASDGFYHHNIQKRDRVCWPTNLGWMMGPWLVFASLINKASIALSYDTPLGEDFGKFVQNAKVTMLGVVPSLVRVWKSSQCMEKLDWSNIKCFSSTGECSNPEDMSYLMDLAGNKPVIEYCGGTETGGGYITGTVVQPCIPGTFSTPALGGGFVILDENNKESSQGEVFLEAPILGLSNRLLNRDHHKVYYEGCPKINGKTLRRHGDQIEKLPNGYFKAHGRMDDAMNLGGIKVSSTQIEETINKLSFVKESAAVGVPPKQGGPDRLVMCIVLDEEISLEEALKETQMTVKKKINPLFKVTECVFYDSLPRTASNKVMRRKLRDELRNR